MGTGVIMSREGCLAGEMTDGSYQVMTQAPGQVDRHRWSAGLPPPLAGLDDDHVAAAAWAWRARIDRIFGTVLTGFGRDVEHLADEGEVGLAGRAREQAIMPDAVEAARKDVEQEPADKLIGRDRHDTLAVGAVLAIILVAKGNASTVKGQETPVRYRDPVSISRASGFV